MLRALRLACFFVNGSKSAVFLPACDACTCTLLAASLLACLLGCCLPAAGSREQDDDRWRWFHEVRDSRGRSRWREQALVIATELRLELLLLQVPSLGTHGLLHCNEGPGEQAGRTAGGRYALLWLMPMFILKLVYIYIYNTCHMYYNRLSSPPVQICRMSSVSLARIARAASEHAKRSYPSRRFSGSWPSPSHPASARRA